MGAGGWAFSTELAGAVIASGTVVVESDVKRVQHPTGGVVGELRVRDGDKVTEGEILVRLDETVTRANLAIVLNSLDQAMAREARLKAERDDSTTVDFPEELTSRADDERSPTSWAARRGFSSFAPAPAPARSRSFASARRS